MGRLQKKITFKGGGSTGAYFFLGLEMILKQFWTIKYSKTVKYFDDLKQFTAFKVANMLESGGGLNQPTPSRSPQKL